MLLATPVQERPRQGHARYDTQLRLRLGAFSMSLTTGCKKQAPVNNSSIAIYPSCVKRLLRDSLHLRPYLPNARFLPCLYLGVWRWALEQGLMHLHIWASGPCHWISLQRRREGCRLRQQQSWDVGYLSANREAAQVETSHNQQKRDWRQLDKQQTLTATNRLQLDRWPKWGVSR